MKKELLRDMAVAGVAAIAVNSTPELARGQVNDMKVVECSQEQGKSRSVTLSILPGENVNIGDKSGKRLRFEGLEQGEIAVFMIQDGEPIKEAQSFKLTSERWATEAETIYLEDDDILYRDPTRHYTIEPQMRSRQIQVEVSCVNRGR